MGLNVTKLETDAKKFHRKTFENEIKQTLLCPKITV